MRRKPKQLDEQPDLLLRSTGGGGFIVPAGRDDRRRRSGTGTPGPGAFTDEAGARVDDVQPPTVDLAARTRARQIASKLALAQVIPRERAPRSATGTLRTSRWRDDSGDIDLDATLEVLAANPLPSDDDILVRRRVRRQRSIVLVADISGSARGEQVRTAAATVGALVGELGRDALSVIAFWSDSALIAPLGSVVSPEGVVDDLMALPTQGLTNVDFALRTAADQLRGVSRADARVLLLSDCVHNAGPDPRGTASVLPRLDVLVDISGENDLDLARDLAADGRGRCVPIVGYRDVAPALRTVFGG